MSEKLKKFLLALPYVTAAVAIVGAALRHLKRRKSQD